MCWLEGERQWKREERGFLFGCGSGSGLRCGLGRRFRSRRWAEEGFPINENRTNMSVNYIRDKIVEGTVI